MQIVIEIPNEDYQRINSKEKIITLSCNIVDAVKNGTPLPKGHGRLIDADEFIERIKPYNTDDYADKALYNFAFNHIISCPTVQAVPQQGHWIEDEYEMVVRCSECGEENDECSKYCPNCGLRMIEPQESEV